MTIFQVNCSLFLVLRKTSLLACFRVEIENNIVDIVLARRHGNSELSQIIRGHYEAFTINNRSVKLVEGDQGIGNGKQQRPTAGAHVVPLPQLVNL